MHFTDVCRASAVALLMGGLAVGAAGQSESGTSSSQTHRRHKAASKTAPAPQSAGQGQSSGQSTTAVPAQDGPPPPKGTVLFERKDAPPASEDGDMPEPAAPVVTAPVLKPNPAAPGAPEGSSNNNVSSSAAMAVGDAEAKRAAAVTDAERSAVTVTAYDLDLHLTQATGAATVRAQVTVKNAGAAAVTKVVLQVSSALRWQSARLRQGTGGVVLPMEQHMVDTDADHTGTASEVVLPLPKALEPGASADLDLFYGGALVSSQERLQRIGAPAAQAAAADWDGFGTTLEGDAPDVTGVRGFGNVLWYPVAAPVAMLGDGNKLFTLIDKEKAAAMGARFRLRLTLEYVATPPDAAFFCGQRVPLLPFGGSGGRENAGGEAAGHGRSGVAVAEWTLPRLGFRSPSLFIAVPSPSETDGHLLEAVTAHVDTVPVYAASAKRVQPMMQEWLGGAPLEPLWMLDLSSGGDARRLAAPFEDGALLALPMHAAPTETLAPMMVHALTHTWFHAEEPWMTEGLAQFLTLQWIERTDGRDAALAQLNSGMQALALVDAGGGGEPVATCGSEICSRSKAAYIWMMLKELAGEDALKAALTASRSGKGGVGAFEGVLEKASGKDLKWFFDDWVLQDKGLPDLSIVAVTPRQIAAAPAATQIARGEGGWFVAIEVANDGGAAVEVPVTVRSGALTTTEPLLVPAHAHATKRVVFQSTPEEVLAGDGTIPEQRSNVHRFVVNAPTNVPNH